MNGATAAAIMARTAPLVSADTGPDAANAAEGLLTGVLTTPASPPASNSDAEVRGDPGAKTAAELDVERGSRAKSSGNPNAPRMNSYIIKKSHDT